MASPCRSRLLTSYLRCPRCRQISSQLCRPFTTSRRHHIAKAHEERTGEDASRSNTGNQTKSVRGGGGLSALRALRKEREWVHRNPEEPDPNRIFKQSRDIPIRARFAPSPTGYLHLGGLRTALFNNLVAKATGGQFIVRIEDTDQSRLVKDAETRLFKDLRWAGLEWDEGPDKGGPHGPYRQSERLDIYKKHVTQLLDHGHAYRCFCSSEQLDGHRRRQMEAGQSVQYPGTCRTINPKEAAERAVSGESHVVRFKGDVFGRPSYTDCVHGTFKKKDEEEDFIIFKTDGFPTYHFANVVDDHLMQITHVIRGEEWLISTPKHLALYQAFGWQPPQFAHLGLLVGLDGYKLSKRDASATLEEYQRAHTFPMAMLHWLANLGCSTRPTASTIRTLKELADNMTFKFTSGSIMLNIEKLARFQHQYSQKILHDPPPQDADLYAHEESLIYDNLVAPVLKEVDNMAAGTVYSVIAENLKRPFRQDDVFVPVPALAHQSLSAGRDGVSASASSKYSLPGAAKEPPFDPDVKWTAPTEKPDEEDEEPDVPSKQELNRRRKKLRTARQVDSQTLDNESPETSFTTSDSSSSDHIPGKGLLPAQTRPAFTLPSTFAEDFDSRTDYIINILTARTGELVSANKLISNHPYLFFQLPPHAYHSLPYNTILHLEPYLAAFDAILSDKGLLHLWTPSTSSSSSSTPPVRSEETQHSQLVTKVTEWLLAYPRATDKKGLHAAVRMVLAGCGPEVSTMPTGAMLKILGRREVLRRMTDFKEVLLSLEKPTDREGSRVEWWFEEGYDVAGKEAW